AVVGPVSVPEAINRPQLVIIDRSGDLRVLEQERWIEPLPDAIRGALALRLSAELPDAAVLEYGQGSAPRAAYQVRIQIRRFDMDVRTGICLDAHWQLVGPGTVLAREGDSLARTALTNNSYQALVSA